MKEQKTSPILARKQGIIFGIRLNSTSTSSVLAYVKYRIKNRRKLFIVTPNPEIVLASTYDYKLKAALNKSDLALPDGIGLAQASRFLSLPKTTDIMVINFIIFILEGFWVGLATFFKKDWLTKSLTILPGREVFLALCGLANKNSWKVFLLGGFGGVSERVAQKLGRKYKKIKFAFADGPKLNKDGETDAEVDILIQKRSVEKINKFKPQFLFVALGPTKQEKWLAKNLQKLNVGGGMAVGGTFNYIVGESKLPPKWMENLGLEWVWRGVTEPWRIGRIFNAVVVFPWKVFLYKMSK